MLYNYIEISGKISLSKHRLNISVIGSTNTLAQLTIMHGGIPISEAGKF